VAGGHDGCPPNVSGASQPMHEESDRHRRMTPVTHSSAWGCTSMCDSSTGSLCPGRRAVWKQGLVGSKERQLARWPPVTPQSTSQVNPGHTADNPVRHGSERHRANTSGGSPRLQTTMVCIKAGKHMWRLQGERALQLPHTWCTGRQCGHDWSRTQQGSRDNVLARSRGEASGWDDYTGRQCRSKESRRALGKTKGMQGGIWQVDVVDGRISNRWWKGRSRSCVLAQWLLDGLPQLPQNRANKGVWCGTVGDRSHTLKVHCNGRGATSTQSHDSGSP